MKINTAAMNALLDNKENIKTKIKLLGIKIVQRKRLQIAGVFVVTLGGTSTRLAIYPNVRTRPCNAFTENDTLRLRSWICYTAALVKCDSIKYNISSEAVRGL